MVKTPGTQNLRDVLHFLQNHNVTFACLIEGRTYCFGIFSDSPLGPYQGLTYKISTKTNTKRMKEVEQIEKANADIKKNSSYSPSSSCKFADLCELQGKLCPSK